MESIAILDQFVSKDVYEISTVTCEADTSSSLAGDSWTFVTTDKDGTDTVSQVYYVVAGVGANPILGTAEASKFVARADSSSDLASKYFLMYNGNSTTETDYYAYFTVAGAGYDPKLGRAEISRVTIPADTAGDKDGTYWNLATGADQAKYVWYSKDTSTTDPNPSSVGTTHGMKVDYSSGDSATTMAGKTWQAMRDSTNGSNFSTTHIHSTNGTAQVTDVVAVADDAGSLSGTYFTMAIPTVNDTAAVGETFYYVWIDVDNGSTDPNVGSSTGVEVDISADDTADTVGTAVASAVNGLTGTGASNSSGTVTITHAYEGRTELPKDAPADRYKTGFTFEDPATTPGADIDILVQNIASGNATNASDGDTGVTVAVATAGVDVVGGLSAKTLLAVIPVATANDNDDTVNSVTHTALDATVFSSVRTAGVAGYQEGGLTGKSAGDETGLAADTQYYYKLTVDAVSITEYDFTTGSSVAGYQEFGLSAKTGTTETGLSDNTQYSLNINVDAAGVVDEAFTTPVAASAYQAVDCTATNGTTETGLSKGTQYYFKVNTDGAGIVEYDVTPPNTAGWEDALVTATDGTTETGLADATQYYFKTNIDGGGVNEDNITTAASAAAYQEFGLAGLSAADETSLQQSNTYWFKVNTDGAGVVEYSVVAPAFVKGYQKWGFDAAKTGSSSTGFADDATEYDFNVNVNAEGNQPIAIVGSTAQTMNQAITQINIQMTGAEVQWDSEGNGWFKFISNEHDSTPSTIALTDTDFFNAVLADSKAAAESAVAGTEFNYTQLMGLMNTATTGLCTVAISGGDLRLSSDLASSKIAGSIAVTAGTTGTDLLANLAGGITMDGAQAGTGDTRYTAVMALMNTALGEAATFTISGANLRLTTDGTGYNRSVAQAAGTTGTDLYVTLTGWSAFDSAVAGTGDTRYTAIMALMNTATTGLVTWSIDGNTDLRATSDLAASKVAGSVALSAGQATDLYAALTGWTDFESAVAGTGDTRYTAVIAQINGTIAAGATAAISGGDLRITSDSADSDSAIAIIAGTTGTDLLVTLTDFSAMEGAVAGTSNTKFSDMLTYLNAGAALATWALNGGDVRVTSDSLGAGSLMEMGAGTTGTDLFATISGWSEESDVVGVAPYVTVTHPTVGNCTASADGDVGGDFTVSTSTGGGDPTPTYTAIPVAIAEDAANTVVAIATRAAINAELNVVGNYMVTTGISTADVIITNTWPGVVADMADVDTGWGFSTDTGGSAVSVTNMITSLSTSNYKYKPDLDEVAYIRSITVTLSDSAANDPAAFGALSALTNGFNINIVGADGAVVKELVGAIKTNAAVTALGQNSWIIGTTEIGTTWNLVDAYGGEVRVDGRNGQYIEMDQDDNPNGLVSFYMRVRGHVKSAVS